MVSSTVWTLLTPFQVTQVWVEQHKNGTSWAGQSERPWKRLLMCYVRCAHPTLLQGKPFVEEWQTCQRKNIRKWSMPQGNATSPSSPSLKKNDLSEPEIKCDLYVVDFGGLTFFFRWGLDFSKLCNWLWFACFVNIGQTKHWMLCDCKISEKSVWKDFLPFTSLKWDYIYL